MELLLNILWLTLLLPALVLWRRHTARLRSSRKQYGPRSFVLLGCLLALLFPVVSASDDLHPVSAEFEESFKRTVKLPPHFQHPAWTHNWVGPAQLGGVAWFDPRNEQRATISEFLPAVPRHHLVYDISDRAPPVA
jgi:hypothetical protein